MGDTWQNFSCGKSDVNFQEASAILALKNTKLDDNKILFFIFILFPLLSYCNFKVINYRAFLICFCHFCVPLMCLYFISLLKAFKGIQFLFVLMSFDMFSLLGTAKVRHESKGYLPKDRCRTGGESVNNHKFLENSTSQGD